MSDFCDSLIESGCTPLPVWWAVLPEGDEHW